MSPVRLVKQTISEFGADNATLQAAGLAYYTVLSLAPLLVILLWIVGIMGSNAQNALINELQQLVGSEGGQAIRTIIQNASSRQQTGTIAGVIGIAMLVFGATGVFAQLQSALNTIFDVRPSPRNGIWAIVRKRLISAGMLLAVGFLLLVSTALSAGISAALQYARDRLPGSDLLWNAVNLLVPLVVMVLLFAAMYRILPDVRIPWKDVWTGGIFTAVLFSVGRYLIGLYLGRSTMGSTYGAAGSFVALLVWVYYSSIVLFLGAELTQVWARRDGRKLIPEEHAEITPEEERPAERRKPAA